MDPSLPDTGASGQGRSVGRRRFVGVRLLVFDLDGTLVDSSRDLAAAVNAMLAALQPLAAPIALADVRAFVGDGARSLVARSLAARGLGVAPEAGLSLFLDAYRERLLDTTRLYPGAEAALAALGAGRTLAVLSNKPGGMSRQILSGLGVLGSFARVYGGDEVPRKPDPGGLLRLIGELGADPGATLMVGDSANDVKAARAAGVAAIGARYGYGSPTLPAERPDALIDSLRELRELVG